MCMKGTYAIGHECTSKLCLMQPLPACSRSGMERIGKAQSVAGCPHCLCIKRIYDFASLENQRLFHSGTRRKPEIVIFWQDVLICITRLGRKHALHLLWQLAFWITLISCISPAAFGRRGAGVGSVVLADRGRCMALDSCIPFGTSVAFRNMTAVS